MSERKTALVTGAGSGIGRAIALRFAWEGIAVLAVDQNQAGLDETAALAEPGAGAGADIAGFVADVRAAEAPDAAVAEAVRRFGGLTYLVNNAGIGGAKSAADTTDEAWDRYSDINLRAVFRFSRAALPHLPPGVGAIVNMASVFGLFGHPNTAPYAATKAGVVGLTIQMAADCGPNGVRVNAIAPGVIETPLTRARIDTDQRFNALNIDPIPFPRLGKPEDVANAAYFLCSDQASYINGHVLAVDGGWSVTNYSRRGAAL